MLEQAAASSITPAQTLILDNFEKGDEEFEFGEDIVKKFGGIQVPIEVKIN